MEILKFNKNSNLNENLGGKGASLFKLSINNINVPKGFIISTNIFKKCLEENNILFEIQYLLNKVEKNNLKSIENTSSKIKELFENLELKKEIEDEIISNFTNLNLNTVAVRSSANIEDGKNNAWAGIFDSFLNVQKDNLIESIINCWKSLYSTRAISYRLENNFMNQKIEMAVIVQEMVASEVSGIAFSINPTTQNKNEIYIEAVFGLGEYLVSGKINPDSYIVNKENFEVEKEIKEQKIGLFFNGEIDFGENYSKQQKLSNEKIIELSKIIKRIEIIYDLPIDIEFGVFQNNLYILQVRPITTFENINDKNENKDRNETKQLSTKKLSKKSQDFLKEIQSYTWGGFKNTSRPLFAASLWSQGIRNPIKELMEFMPFEDIEINTKNHQHLRCFTYQPNKKSFNHINRNLKVSQKLILKYIDESYNLLKKIKEIQKLIIKYLNENNHKNIIKYTFELLKIHDKINFFEAYTNALISMHMELNKINNVEKLDIKIRNWRNDETFDSQNNFFKNIIKYIKKNSIKNNEFEIEDFHNFIHINEFKKLLKKEITLKEINEKIEFRKLNGYILINLELKGYQNTVLDKQEIVQFIENYIIKLHNERIKKRQKDGKLFGNSVLKLDKKIQGECIVVMQENDLSSDLDLKNKILITTMTTPEFMPYLKGVKGIITDNGGVICHAAIISREFNIPAIIGAEGATSIFKTKDKIEMNLNEGSVRKI